jgi:signal transduction histidine kinase
MTSLAVVGNVRGWWRDAVPHWREGWAALPSPARALWLLVVGWALVGTVVMGAQVGDADFLFGFSTWTYAVVPAGAGLVLVLAALKGRQPGTAAWVLIGLGVFFWGVGELIWVYYSGFLGVEVPYPGWADVFYVGAYPFVFAGVLMLPHVRARKWERARLSLDALAGTVALSAIVWTFYLQDAIYLDPEAGLLENTINFAYPVGDLILLIGLLVLATRRSQYQFDGRLLLLALATLVTAVADIAYVFQLEAGTYVDGGRLDALWLVDYGLYAAAAVLVAAPARLREQADRPGRLWPMIAPYTAIAVLFALTLGELGGQANILQVATAVVGLLIIARQGVAIRESREVVEKQRNDLVASISHELRTPLTSMYGFTDMLDQDPDLDRAERIEMISIVNSQTKHLNRIVGDLVDVARDNLESKALTYTTVDIEELVDSAIGMLTNGAATAHITTSIAPGLTITGDQDRLLQVLVNYLTNAGRYGNGQVQIHAHPTINGTIIEVHDNGPGIPRKHEVTIWDRFERGAHTYLSKVQGSGLGLAIARQLVAAHNGHTGHHPSERLGGACFWLTLPNAQATHTPKPATTSTHAA